MPTVELVVAGGGTKFFEVAGAGTTVDPHRFKQEVSLLPALVGGTANIGDVDVLTLPVLPAGTNNIGDVDVLSIIPGTGATNLGKVEDSAAANGDVGVAIFAVRKDAVGTTVGTDGDYAVLQLDSSGNLRSIDVAATASLTSIDTKLNGTNTQVYDSTALWANSAAANTVVNKDVALPTPLQRQAMYLITIINPSTVTALNVKVQTKETISAVDHYADLTSFSVAANGKTSTLVQGWLLGAAGRLALTNATALGAADTFTALVRVRSV